MANLLKDFFRYTAGHFPKGCLFLRCFSCLASCSLKEGTLNMELLQFKLRFPREVLLCRVCNILLSYFFVYVMDVFFNCLSLIFDRRLELICKLPVVRLQIHWPAISSSILLLLLFHAENACLYGGVIEYSHIENKSKLTLGELLKKVATSPCCFIAYDIHLAADQHFLSMFLVLLAVTVWLRTWGVSLGELQDGVICSCETQYINGLDRRCSSILYLWILGHIC